MSERQPKPIRLAINLLASGRHNASWKTLDQPDRLSLDIDRFVAIAQLAEQGRLDGIFMADNLGGLTPEAYKRPWRAIAPSILLAHLAAHTRHIGLVSTVNALYGSPALLAREIASLDHVSKGRAAWNIVTSQHDFAQTIFGTTAELTQDEKYAKAEEFVSIVTGLWGSLPVEAIVADIERTVYVDAARLRPIDFTGTYFSSHGTLGIPGGYAERPVIVQAGASESSKRFGSRWADALFTSHWNLPDAQGFYRDVKQAAAGYGRNPAGLLIFPGLYPILGATEAQALRRKRDLDDQLDLEHAKGALATMLGIASGLLDLSKPLPYDSIDLNGADMLTPVRRREKLVKDAQRRNLTTRDVLVEYVTGGHRIVIGTPEQVADDIIDWIDGDGADGFNFNVDTFPSGLHNIVEGLVPELQRRGRFRLEYESSSFRGNLGLR
ncbi:NtaA/DmoA family FMN-dependent monooxygenase [Xylophilus sp.]|uniref:NtaA/DmoA family FMN-dependent monooxygenase n=1 Tax=Xylophilus sp. TaxID=2653893 RepID=UPI0013BA5441|nr:NtaA/DmoA family FMN-dependent monooxygenase [Xylophilus sp.]KAF1042967.1 MAG: Nitrilotriacetate monooxygenase component A [Xylophilus sp.]